MNQVVITDAIRAEANSKLDPKRKSELGQFMTSDRIAKFMAELFVNTEVPATLLDAGAGIGSLTVAASKRLKIKKIEAWELDPIMLEYLRGNLKSLNVDLEIHSADFIESAVNMLQFRHGARFTHAILNPPYKKIGTGSKHRELLRQVGVETVNLYTAFLALSILLMQPGGEIVVIIPRSFCNGPYYKPFRSLMFHECSLDHIHIFESRTKAFKDDDVLQENVILKLTRGKAQKSVAISFSHDSQFKDYQCKDVPFESVVKPEDSEKFIHIPAKDLETLGTLFEKALKDLGVDVSTGPVVDFRLREYFAAVDEGGCVPLFYSHHFTNDGFQHPKEHKKPNFLRRSVEVDKWLMPNGWYVLIKRFSAKEERRRVVAHVFDPAFVRSGLVGFENHWNVLHVKKTGMDKTLARGLGCFLNSTALDEYFRVFSGHTQVNATDLRNMKFPDREKLLEMGRKYKADMSQEEIDNIVAGVA